MKRNWTGRTNLLWLGELGKGPSGESLVAPDLWLEIFLGNIFGTALYNGKAVQQIAKGKGETGPYLCDLGLS